MKRTYKILFWITIIALIFSNLFWIYFSIDNAVGHHYYKVSCDEYKNDLNEFMKTIESFNSKKETIDFLEENSIQFDSIQKGNEFIIIFNSFEIVFRGEEIKFNNY
jgi:wyosine [tRNA(Phe)-imidazoG37] synthetase (radical SAM superfamily)